MRKDTRYLEEVIKEIEGLNEKDNYSFRGEAMIDLFFLTLRLFLFCIIKPLILFSFLLFRDHQPFLRADQAAKEAFPILVERNTLNARYLKARFTYFKLKVFRHSEYQELCRRIIGH